MIQQYLIRRIVILSLVLLIAGCIEKKPADHLIESFIARTKTPGVFAAVVQNDSILFQAQYGFADMASGRQVSASTCFELGSVSKLFTSQIIYGLFNQGLLKPEDLITKFLRDSPASWSGITIHQLLTHSSGIQNYLLDPRFKAAAFFGAEKDSAGVKYFQHILPDSMIKMFYDLPLEFAPGAGWSYSNTGYYILGKIAEKAGGKSFFELADEILTKPIGMSATKRNEFASENNCLARGYIVSDSSVQVAPVLYSNYAFAAGTFASTGDDMIRFMKAVHSRLLPMDRYDASWRSRPRDEMPFTYENGCFYSVFHGQQIISHNGGTPGFSSSWIYLPKKNISVVVLMNRQDFAPVDQLAWDILTEVEPSVKFPDKVMKGEEEKQYEKKLAGILDGIQSRTSYPESLSEKLRQFMESENGRGLWQWYFSSGFPQSIECVDTEMMENGKAFRFRLSFSEKTHYRLTMIVNSNGEIAQLLWW